MLSAVGREAGKREDQNGRQFILNPEALHTGTFFVAHPYLEYQENIA